MRLGRRRTVVSDINVTPMADIMIVLLIIFMVTLPVITGSPVPLPDARHAHDDPKDAITLVVTPEGGAQIGNEQPMDVPTLSAYLRARVDTSRVSVPIVVQADRDADYAAVAHVLQACRLAGIDEIGLATRPRVGEP